MKQQFVPKSTPKGKAPVDDKVPYFFNKRVVITGALGGIGKALSWWFLNNGAQVVMVVHSDVNP